MLASQRLGIKEVDDGIWLVSFMHYDLGYFEPEQNLAIPRQPVRHEVATHVLGTFCYLCVRAGQFLDWRKGWVVNCVDSASKSLMFQKKTTV